MHYLIWVPALIIYIFFYGWLSIKNNQYADIVWYQSKWFWICFVYGAICPFWVFISRTSKNLIFDGMLYDVLLFVTFVCAMIFFGKAESFNRYQWIGVLLVTAGFFLLHADNGALKLIAK